jgi:hypothetical protein
VESGVVGLALIAANSIASVNEAPSLPRETA